MPTVTYTGSQHRRRNNDVTMSDWVRGEPREVSDEWVAHWGSRLGDDFRIEGAHTDLGNDGIPDSGWTKANIMSWLDSNGATVGGGFKTKSTLLEMVEEVLNPTPVAEPIAEAVEEPIVEEVVEEPAAEAVETVETGDDE